MISPSPQIDLSSLAAPRDRTLLTVREVAQRWRVSDQHVIDLLQEGKLNGFDIGGRYDYVRVPVQALESIAQRSGLPLAELRRIIDATRPRRAPRRAYWRIPVREGFEQFMRENHSHALAD